MAKNTVNKNASSPHELTFFVVSDPHVTYPIDSDERLSRDSVGILGNTIVEIEETGADAVFFTGDILEARYQGRRNLDIAFEALSKLSIPWFVLIGNHDLRHESTSDDYEKSDFIKKFKGHGPSESQAFWRYDPPGKKLVFIGLDSTRPKSTGGAIDNGQFEWLRKTLTEIDDGYYVIILSHHPFIVFDKEIDEIDEMRVFVLENHKEVKNLVERHKNVKLVISGHNHTRRTVKDNGVVYIGCPSINTWPAMYSRFLIDSNRIRCFHLPIKETNKVEEVKKNVLSEGSPWVRILGSPVAVRDYLDKGPTAGEFSIG